MTFEFNDKRSEPIVLAYPLTVEFDINRSLSMSEVSATFKLYNLSKPTRDLIHKDSYLARREEEQVRLVFECGYNDVYSIAFRGIIGECQSYLDGGSNEVITEIYCWDNAVYRYVNKTYNAGTSVREVLKDVAEALNLENGSNASFETTFRIPYTMNGKIINELQTLTAGCTFIDNGIMHTLKPMECLDYGVPIFNSNNIFGTPRRTETYVNFKTFLSPQIMLTQLVEIKDSIQNYYDGIVKVCDIKHVGSISGGVPCEAHTELLCYYGNPQEVVQEVLQNSEDNKDDENPKNNVAQKIKDFVIVQGDKIKNKIYGKNGSLKYIYFDILENGNKAKSLNEYVPGTYITWREMIDSPNLDGYARPDLQHIENMYNLLHELLDFIRINIGNVKIMLRSANRGDNLGAWRSQTNNKRVGGKRNSRHLTGRAIDFSFSNQKLNQEYYKIISKKWKKGFTGLYDWGIHVQDESMQPDTK